MMIPLALDVPLQPKPQELAERITIPLPPSVRGSCRLPLVPEATSGTLATLAPLHSRKEKSPCPSTSKANSHNPIPHYNTHFQVDIDIHHILSFFFLL
ncbi:MAG: hypothetical protein H7839_04310 [Magnetococcus sp. YQC-5]